MARTPRRGDSWSARQVYLAAGCSKTLFAKAARAGFLEVDRLGSDDVVILRVAVSLSVVQFPGMTRPANEERRISGWERAAIALTREALGQRFGPPDLLLLVSERNVCLVAGSDRTKALRELAASGAFFVCLPVGAWREDIAPTHAA